MRTAAAIIAVWLTRNEWMDFRLRRPHAVSHKLYRCHANFSFAPANLAWSTALSSQIPIPCKPCKCCKPGGQSDVNTNRSRNLGRKGRGKEAQPS